MSSMYGSTRDVIVDNLTQELIDEKIKNGVLEAQLTYLIRVLEAVERWARTPSTPVLKRTVTHALEVVKKEGTDA